MGFFDRRNELCQYMVLDRNVTEHGCKKDKKDALPHIS